MLQELLHIALACLIPVIWFLYAPHMAGSDSDVQCCVGSGGVGKSSRICQRSQEGDRGSLLSSTPGMSCVSMGSTSVISILKLMVLHL